MSGAMWGAIGSALALALLVAKYILSGQAAKDAADAKAKDDEQKHEVAQDGQIEQDHASAPSQSAGAGNAWDAADAEMQRG